MGRSWYPMTREGVVEDFVENNSLTISETGLTYRMTERDGRFFMKQFLVDSGGREIAADEREMAHVAGSGNHSRSYVTEVDGKLFQMPVCWYPLTGTWDLCPGYEHKNDGFTRPISTTCVFCHNARMEVLPGARNAYGEPIPDGIDCERCHGAGSVHVDKWKAGDAAPTGAADPSIVNPRRLERNERIQICLQCHLGDSLAGERVTLPDRPIESYKPGMALSDVMAPFRYAQATEARFGISAQADRFILSRCYTESDGAIECLTCHDPHVTVYRADRDPETFRRACLGCHTEAACSGPAASREETTPRDDCVTCHMRRAEPDDHRHTLFTDHWIRRRAVEPSTAPLGSIELEPVFPEAFARLSPADRSYARGRAYFLKGLDAPPPVRSSMWAIAERSFREAAAAGFAGPEAPFFLGKTLGFLGRHDQAGEAFREAHARDPRHHDAAFAWGQSLLRRGRADEAARVFEEMLEVEPRSAAALSELGRCRLIAGRADEALALYERAIAEEPWTANLHANRAMILFALGRVDDAVRAAADAVRRGPEDSAMWRTFSEVTTRAGRADLAREARIILDRLDRRPAAEPAPRGMMGMGGS